MLNLVQNQSSSPFETLCLGGEICEVGRMTAWWIVFDGDECIGKV